MTETTRRELLADEIGPDNVVLVADAYRQGWGDCRFAVRTALLTTEGAALPTTEDATRTWLTERYRHLRWSWRAEEDVRAVSDAEPDPAEEDVRAVSDAEPDPAAEKVHERRVRGHDRRAAPDDAGEEIVARVCRVMRYVEAELLSAVRQFDPYHSAHEGYSVILEELDELWDEIKANKLPGARARQRAEAVQVAATAARFLLDIQAEEGEPS